jgi:hypothetical protein
LKWLHCLDQLDVEPLGGSIQISGCHSYTSLLK